MTSSQPWTGQEGWHRADWGPLGLAETVLKLFGIGVAVIALLGGGAFSVPDDHRVAYWLLLLPAVGYLFALFDRLQDREITAMGFWALMVLGHWSIVWAAGGDEWPAGAVALFALAMAAGDVVKIVFFGTTGARVRDNPRWVPFVLTGILLAVYLLIAAFALV